MLILIPGEKHCYLTYLGMSEIKRADQKRVGRFLCDCGNKIDRPLSWVISGVVKSCGCIRRLNNLKHGMSNKPEYISWRAMKARVEDVNHEYHSYYSGLVNDKDILDSFSVFFKEVGYRPSKKHSIDRIDNSLGYIHGNMRWATRKEQERNKKRTYHVRIKGMFFDSPSDAATFFGVTRDTIYRWCLGYFESKTGKQVSKKEWAETIPLYP